MKFKSFATTTEQVAYTPGMIVIKNDKRREVKNAEHLSELLEDDWTIAVGVSRPSTGSTGKRKISKAEAQRQSDANLSESFGIPSTLVAKGQGFEFRAKVVSFIEQPKRNGKGVFPSTQVSYEGTPFCILFDGTHDIGVELNCRLDAAPLNDQGVPVTRSGLTVMATV